MITIDDLPAVLDAHREWLVSGRKRGDWADLAGANLFRANLSRANLAWADLAGANLAGANLAGANLAGANLAGANLFRADLAGADLAGADLSGANLAGADLAGADLAGADLAGADLAGANLSRANLSWAKGIATAGPVGSEGRLIYGVVTADHGMMVQAGCWWGSVDDLRARIAPGGEHGWPTESEDRWQAEYEAAIEFLTARLAVTR